MTFDIEETIELIDMHGKTLLEGCCDTCGLPLKEIMLAKVGRIIELIQSLPEHEMEVEIHSEGRTAH